MAVILSITKWAFPLLSLLIYTQERWNRNTPVPVMSACSLTVDAGPDTNVCAPAGMLTLMGSVTGSPLLTIWSPSTGLSNPLILNPVANITDPITYTLTAWGIDPDNPSLITNGDFSQGNVGFTTDYAYMPNIDGQQTELSAEGTYTVIHNPNLVHAQFAACSDHTGGGGNMMVVNGSGSLQDVWCQTITVDPDSYYNVAAWVASVHPTSPAKLRFSINGTPIGNIVNAPSATCNWVPFNATWYSGSNTTAEICILNLNTALGGNDFAIDDISIVSLCSAEDEVDITLYEEDVADPVILGPTEVCAGDVGVYTATFPPGGPDIYTYIWTLPPGATIISGEGYGQITIRWDEAQQAQLCLQVLTRCDESDACIDMIISDIPEQPLISGPTELCPGEIVTLYIPEQSPDDEYNWTIPPEVSLISGQGTNEVELQWSNAGEAEICVEVTNECGSNDNCTYLTLSPGYQHVFDTILCTGTTININGNTYGNGVWSGIETFTTIHGCDSIVQVEISEASSLEFTNNVNLCAGNAVFAGGALQTQAGTYLDSYFTISGCDSLVFTVVNVISLDTTINTAYTCDPSQAGTTTNTFVTSECDSIVITEVVFTPSDTTILSSYSCFPADTGQAQQILVNQSGCDSLVITHTYLLPSNTTLLYNTTCDPLQAGVFVDVFTNVEGCDSTVVNNVFYLLSDTTILSALSCNVADTGTVETLFVNSEGCDSLVILQTYYGGSDPVFFNSTTCDPAEAGVTVNTYTNINGCDSVITTTVSLLPQANCEFDASYSVMQPACFGDKAVIEIQIETGLAPFTFQWRSADADTLVTFNATGNYTIVFDIQGPTMVTLTSANGLKITGSVMVDHPELLLANAETISSYNGYAIACFGESNGAAEVIATGGTGTLTYLWSNGQTDPEIHNIPAGNYFVTVVDANGCKSVASVLLTEPTEMQFEYSTRDISCFGEEDGSVELTSTSGGVMPWTTSIDGRPFTSENIYEGLDAGNHLLELKDQNGCIEEIEFTITDPDDWRIDLGNDTSVFLGAVVELTPTITGQPNGNISLTWSDGVCDQCLARTFDITDDLIIGVVATDENGCTSEDIILIKAEVKKDIYIPTAFSPNGDQVNDYFLISSNDLLEIEELSIYDRWGSLVYQKQNFQPNSNGDAWDGQMRGKPLSPGVYVYKITVRYRDGEPGYLTGDITLIR